MTPPIAELVYKTCSNAGFTLFNPRGNDKNVWMVWYDNVYLGNLSLSTKAKAFGFAPNHEVKQSIINSSSVQLLFCQVRAALHEGGKQCSK